MIARIIRRTTAEAPCCFLGVIVIDRDGQADQVGGDGVIVEVVEALSTTLTYDMCGVFTAYYYSFVTTDNQLFNQISICLLKEKPYSIHKYLIKEFVPEN